VRYNSEEAVGYVRREIDTKPFVSWWNRIAIALCLGYVVLSALRQSSPIVRTGVYWYCLPIAILCAAEWMLWRGRSWAAAILMFIGGLGTVPFGLLAIIGSLRTTRVRSVSSGESEPEVHCQRCGYDLRGASTPRCSECGYVVEKR
jgi:ribosomal protein L37E